MPLSKSLSAYNDVRLVLESALESGGAKYVLASEKAAVRWRMRAYYYRSLLAKADREANPQPGYLPKTKWDTMFLTVEGPAVLIEFNKLHGSLQTLDGDKLAVKQPESEPALLPTDDPLVAEALRLVKEKGE